jgi:hypothetical protein
MPDYDYEEVRVGYECYDLPQTPECGCEHCSKINAEKDKAKQIETLLGMISFGTQVDHDWRKVMMDVLKVLKIMNGIE